MNYQDYIKPELLILIPVLYFIGVAIKKSKIRDALIPVLLGCFGVLLAFIYLMAAEPFVGVQGVFTALWTALTQGVLTAAAAVYSNQIIKQAQKYKFDEEEQKED